MIWSALNAFAWNAPWILVGNFCLTLKIDYGGKYQDENLMNLQK